MKTTQNKNYINKVERLRNMVFIDRYLKNISIKAVNQIADELKYNHEDLYFFKAGKLGYAGFVKKGTKHIL